MCILLILMQAKVGVAKASTGSPLKHLARIKVVGMDLLMFVENADMSAPQSALVKLKDVQKGFLDWFGVGSVWIGCRLPKCTPVYAGTTPMKSLESVMLRIRFIEQNGGNMLILENVVLCLFLQMHKSIFLMTLITHAHTAQCLLP